MRVTNLLITALGLVATAVAAQPPGPPRGGPRGPGGRGFDIEQLTILLDLDTYQKTELERVLDEQRAAFAAERKAADAADAAGTQLSFDDVRARREQAREETLTKLQSVLTLEQITKFKVLTERPNPPPGRPARGPAGE